MQCLERVVFSPKLLVSMMRYVFDFVVSFQANTCEAESMVAISCNSQRMIPSLWSLVHLLEMLHFRKSAKVAKRLVELFISSGCVSSGLDDPNALVEPLYPHIYKCEIAIPIVTTCTLIERKTSGLRLLNTPTRC